MTDADRSSRVVPTHGWLWLATAVTSVFVVWVYRTGYEGEAGSRAGAEPAMAGLFVAAPFVAVATVELFAGWLAALHRDRAARLTALGLATIAALGCFLLVAWVLLSAPYPFGRETAVVGVVLLVPLLPGWLTVTSLRPRRTWSRLPTVSG